MRNQRLYAKVPVVGLCHGVAYNCGIIAQRMGIPREEIDFVCAGINHMTWFIQARHKGKDILPAMKETILHYKHIQTGTRRSPQDWVSRAKMLREFGWFTTESDRHIVEYVPWFQNDDHRDLYEYREFNQENKEKRQIWYGDTGVTAQQEEAMELVISHEAASGIIEAITTGREFVFSANVRNDGYITNLPRNCIVEVPCTADGNGLHPPFCGGSAHPVRGAVPDQHQRAAAYGGSLLRGRPAESFYGHAAGPRVRCKAEHCPAAADV